MGIEKKHFLYLVKNKNHTLSKIGYTYTTNPKKRLRNYISHNPECVIEGTWEVSGKKVEKLVHMALLKKGLIACAVKHQKEWFYGNILLMEIDAILRHLQEKT